MEFVQAQVASSVEKKRNHTRGRGSAVSRSQKNINVDVALSRLPGSSLPHTAGKRAITSKIKHAVKLKTYLLLQIQQAPAIKYKRSPARLAQLLHSFSILLDGMPSLAAS